MLFKSDRTLIGVVVLCMSMSILVGKLGAWIPKSNFIAGILLGFSFALNVIYLVRVRYMEE